MNKPTWTAEPIGGKFEEVKHEEYSDKPDIFDKLEAVWDVILGRAVIYNAFIKITTSGKIFIGEKIAKSGFAVLHVKVEFDATKYEMNPRIGVRMEGSQYEGMGFKKITPETNVEPSESSDDAKGEVRGTASTTGSEGDGAEGGN